MPNATIYIKQKDWQKWSQIKNKSEFIHIALRGKDFQDALKRGMKKAIDKDVSKSFEVVMPLKTKQDAEYAKDTGDFSKTLSKQLKKGVSTVSGMKVIRSPKDAEKATQALRDAKVPTENRWGIDNKGKVKQFTCEHGQIKGQCLVVGCKYGRMK